MLSKSYYFLDVDFVPYKSSSADGKANVRYVLDNKYIFTKDLQTFGENINRTEIVIRFPQKRNSDSASWFQSVYNGSWTIAFWVTYRFLNTYYHPIYNACNQQIKKKTGEKMCLKTNTYTRYAHVTHFMHLSFSYTPKMKWVRNDWYV